MHRVRKVDTKSKVNKLREPPAIAGLDYFSAQSEKLPGVSHTVHGVDIDDGTRISLLALQSTAAQLINVLLCQMWLCTL